MLSLLTAAHQIRDRELSPLELTIDCLAQIERLNPTLNAFIAVTADLALEQARQAEKEIAAGRYRGYLHGIPIALKDNIDVAGVRTTAGSNQYRDRIPTEDAEIVKQLKLAGAVIVGKNNMHEFAFGGSGIISAFGPVKNPVDPRRITGGSSSGSAAAVASGMCIAAIGTDTAGSVRCPAALCGVVGYRPSQGLLSNQGIVPLAESFDTPGPITRHVLDASLVASALSPPGRPTMSTAAPSLDRKLRVGVARDLASRLDAEVAAGFEESLRIVRELASEVVEVKLHSEPAWEVRNFEIRRYHEAMLRDTSDRYDPRTLERLRSIPEVEEYEYVKRRQKLQATLAPASLPSGVDLIISPTVPVTAPLISELEALSPAALREYELNSLLRNALPFSFLWMPSISIPCWRRGHSGLPVGLQISGLPGADNDVLMFALRYTML